MTPALTPTHADLQRFTGSWRGTEQLAASPWAPAGENDVAVSARVEVEGFAVVLDQVSSRDGATMVSGHGVFSVDPETSDVIWHWFDSIGYPPLVPARGHWSGNELVVERSTPRGVNRTTWTVGENSLDQRVEYRAPDAEEFSTLILGHLVRETTSA